MRHFVSEAIKQELIDNIEYLIYNNVGFLDWVERRIFMRKHLKSLPKKFVSILLVVLMLTFIAPMDVFAADDDITTYTTETYYDEKGCEYTRTVDENGNEVNLDDDTVYLETSAVTIPSKWDSRNNGWVTSVKSQIPHGTCWAFAFCSTAESSLISQGYETKDSVDLSEAHLVRFKDSYIEGSSEPVHQDHYTNLTDPFEAGGNENYASDIVARGSGLTTEKKFPYSYWKSDMQFNNKDMFEHDYDIVSTRHLTNTKDIKNSIMTYGAVMVSYYHNGDNCYDNCYIDTQTNNYYYYQNTVTGTNHAVTIIGWDDTVSTSSFKTKPAGKGAWLVKNSWGSSFFDGGYHWISYYDTSLKSFAEVVAKPTEYDSVYQYSGILHSSALGFPTSISGANVYTAKGNEEVTSCSFPIYENASYRCTIDLYTNLTGDLPTDGTLAETVNVDCSGQGLYTASFKEKHILEEGERFSVVVKYANKSGSSILPCEGESTSNKKYYSEKGQSFFSSTYSTNNKNATWTDCYTKGANNLPIRVYTKDAEIYNNDAIFAKEDTNTIVDVESKIIYGLDVGATELSKYISVKEGYSYRCDTIATNSSVEIYNEKTNELVDTFTILIYGDIDGDGWYDGQDAVYVSMIINGMLTPEAMGITQQMAADCNHDGVIDENDYLILSEAGIQLNEIDQSSENLSTQSAYSEYVKLIEQ